MRAQLRPLLVALVFVPTLLAACAATPSGAPDVAVHPEQLAAEAGVELTTPPYREVHVQWKERVAQPFVSFLHHGDPATFGDTMRSLLEFSIRARVQATGSPFALYGEDGSARACLPVDGNPGVDGLDYAVLPQAMVAYAIVSGPYPDATRALPGLRAAMSKNGWEPRGPVRATYLVNPAQARHYAELATELQIPWAVTP